MSNMCFSNKAEKNNRLKQNVAKFEGATAAASGWRCQSKCDLPHPQSLEKWSKQQNELFFKPGFLIVMNVYFHSNFNGCLMRHSTLISYMHFYYFKPRFQRL